jgi:hypothetical protein
MMTPATPQHAWLQKFVGTWEYESTCQTGPNEPPLTLTGREVVRAIGDLWIVGESRGQMPPAPDAAPGAPLPEMTAIMTVGFDPAKNKFVGSWIGSPMAFMFHYEGTLEPDGKTLPLCTTGPDCITPGKSAEYQDVVVLVSDNERRLTSRMRTESGDWVEFMTATYRRVK